MLGLLAYLFRRFVSDPSFPSFLFDKDAFTVVTNSSQADAFCVREPEDAGCHTLFLWYVGMCGVSLLNVLLLATAIVWLTPTTSYEKTMKWLAVPWVWECAYRSFFPSLYLQRFVFWNTWLNSIIVDRTFACIGELCWTAQFSFALQHIDKQQSNNKGGTVWIQNSAWAAILVYVAAECVSYYNVATTNELYCALEVILDGLAFLCMAPASIYLSVVLSRRQSDKKPSQNIQASNSITTSSGLLFCYVNSVLCIVYPIYNIVVDVPMYMTRYHQDQQMHKQYLPFGEGIVQAATRRIQTHRLEDWNQDMLWMTLYFSLGAWSALILMFAPKLKTEH
eukprot:m.75551 g.75551  ORF g.75551 m.75551 type:complete len:336 (+) comp12507_c0_seq1:116-1123(+)